MNGPDGKRFPWGRIVQVHSIGPYDIVEYRHHERQRNDLPEVTGFHVYVGGKDACVQAPTLDGALLLAIAWRAEGGRNTMAAHYMAKMVGLEVG